MLDMNVNAIYRSANNVLRANFFSRSALNLVHLWVDKYDYGYRLRNCLKTEVNRVGSIVGKQRKGV